MSFYNHDFDQILKNPDKKELKKCVEEACSTANARARMYLVSPPKLDPVFKKKEGNIDQSGGAPIGSRRSRLAQKESVLGIAWFTDSENIKHIRVISSRKYARENVWGYSKFISKLTPKQIVYPANMSD
ncbi:hypothetical protein ACFL43_01790 [Thermodesulfobacteriota bacterium]